MRITTTLIVLLCGAAIAAGELSLPDAVARLPQTLEWRAADGKLEAARRSLDAARAAAGLGVNVGAEYTNSGVITGKGDSGQALIVTATASVSLLPWSPIFDNVRRREREFEIAALDLRDARNTLLIDLNTQYFELRSAQLDLELNKSIVVLREAQARNTAAQRSNGQATKEQESSAQLNLESARLDLSQAENALDIAGLTLAQLLDLPRVPTTITPPALPRVSSETLDAALKRALTRRSDVMSALIALRNAEDDVSNATRDRWFPNASVNLGVNGTDLGVNTDLNLQTGVLSVSGNTQPLNTASSAGVGGTTFTLSANLNLPLLAPSDEAAINIAQTDLSNVKAAFEQQRRSAELDVRQRYADLRIALKRADLGVRTVQNAQAALQTAEAKLKVGSATKLDVDDARLDVKQSQKDLEVAIVNALLADLKWRNALGDQLTTR